MIKHINETEFKEEIKKDLVLVDFFANWCGPCKMLGPILEKLSNEYEILKVDVDENQNLARELGIMSIPTLMIYSKGEVKDTKMGLMPEEEIKNWLEENK